MARAACRSCLRHGHRNSGWRHIVAENNGAGEQLFVATQLDTSRWLIAERTRRDDRGRSIAIAETYEWNGDLAGLVSSALPVTVAVRTASYDALNRITKQTLPTGAENTIAYRAFESTTTADDLAPVTTAQDIEYEILYELPASVLGKPGFSW